MISSSGPTRNSQFQGAVRIHVRVHEPTSEVVLNAADIQLTRAILVSSGEVASDIRADQKNETAMLRFGRTLEVGRTSSRSSTRARSPSGPKACSPPATAPRVTRSACWPHNSSPSARDAFCRAGMSPLVKLASPSLSRSRTARRGLEHAVEQTSELADGRQRIRFQPSPKMSPYLLFLAIGDLERLEKNVGPRPSPSLPARAARTRGCSHWRAQPNSSRSTTTTSGYPIPCRSSI